MSAALGPKPPVPSPYMNRFAALSAVLALTACGGDNKTGDTALAAAPVARELSVTAKEFTFDAPDTVPAGFARVKLTNQGTEPHHIIFVRLDSGHVVGELLQRMSSEKVPNWAVLLGGPNAPMPGATTETVLELTPGNYAVLCLIPSVDGKPHVAKGMVRQLTVTGPAGETAPPNADIVVTLSDFTFTASPPITPGPHVLRVDNIAEQPHELVMVKLEPGRTIQEFAAWAEKPQGPPPGALVGGTTPQAKGTTNYVITDFAPGDYGFICFMPDAKDGKLHLVHGMIQQFKVG
jgi:hypothetical protein